MTRTDKDNVEEAMASSVSRSMSITGGDPTSVAGESASLPFVSELVACLPDDATLRDVAAACDGCPHNDVVWLPALLVMEAHLTIARVSTAPRSMTPSDADPTPDDRTTDDATPDVGEHLACAACIIKSLFELAVKLRKKREAQAQQTQADSHQPAPICEFDEVVAAALHLRSEVYHVAVRHCIFVRVCTWERDIRGCPSDDAVVQRTGIYWAGDGERRAEVVQEATGAPTPVTAVLKKLRAAAVQLQVTAQKAEAARSASSTAPRTPPAEVPVQKHHVSPYLRFDMPSVLPCELSQGPITCGRAPLQAMRGIKFSWPLPAKIRRLFCVTQWDAPVFDSKAHAAAQCIAASLRELAEKHTHADRQGSDEKRRKRTRSPSPVEGAAQNVVGDELNSLGVVGPSEHSDMAAIFAQLDEINAGIRRLDARYEVKALVAEVNAALTAYCDALLKTISYPKSLLELLRLVFIDSMNRGQGEPASDCRSVYVSGRCPLRAALLAGWATANGEIRPCPECGKVGQCVTQSGYILCDTCTKGRCPTTERRAHIIPHAAATLSETAQLLDRVGGMPMRSGRDMDRYLASAHNLFYLSSCFEECFDNGTLVLVKVGPPELQCYRVTSTTPSTAGTEVTFDKDLQMRDLLSPTQAPVLLSCIDGLVVNLGRPATLRSGKDTFNVPRVSHRFLDLHARAHGRQLQDAPLVAQKYALSAKALAHAPERCAEGLTAITIEAWLDELAGCSPPSGDTSPLF